jgi:hypothetical protein
MAGCLFAVASKVTVKMFFTVGQSKWWQGFWRVRQLAAARQASAGEPVYDRHDSAVIPVNDSAVTGGSHKPVAVEGGDEQQSE